MARHKFFCPTCNGYPTVVLGFGADRRCAKCNQPVASVPISTGMVNVVAIKMDGKRYTEGDIAAIRRGTYSGSVGRSQ